MTADYSTTFRLPRALHQRLIAAARAHKVPYAELIRRGIDLAITERENRENTANTEREKT